MATKKMTEKKVATILNVIETADSSVPRMGGGCYAWAIAIKRVLLPDADLVVCVNKAVFDDDSRLVGHAAVVLGGVEAKGSLWIDSEGRTEKDNVESWGMLDPGEEEWNEHGRPGSLVDWKERDHAEVDTLVFTSEKKLLEYLPAESKKQAGQVEKALRKAM